MGILLYSWIQNKLRRTRRWATWVPRQATSHLRVLPNFLILGAMKSGTTSLYQYLCQHPKVLAAHKKEVYYFDKHYMYGEQWYRGNFPTRRQMKSAGQGTVTGEATPYYLFHPTIAERIANLLPQVSLIVVLRDPVDRAISHYFHSVRRGKENRPIRQAFAEEDFYVKPEEKLLEADHYTSNRHRMWSYVSRGLYAQQLKKYLELFPREQLLVLKSEALFAAPQTSVTTVTDFLDLEPFELCDVKVLNAGTYAKSEPSEVREMRKQLRQYFKPHNQILSELLHEDFTWTEKE